MKFDWNDLKFLDAMLKHGSAKRAAAALGVDQTTCARRIAALEASLQLTLFDREGAGFRPTPSALALENAAAEVAKCIDEFALRAEATRRSGAQMIRITAEETFAVSVVAPAVARFSRDHPQSQVHVDITSERRDLSSGEADVALRAGPAASDEDNLIRLKLSDDPQAIYCSEAYAQRCGVPASAFDLRAHAIVSLQSTVQLYEAGGLGSAVRQVVNSLAAVEAAIRNGACVGALPRMVGDRVSALRMCFPVDAKSEVRLLYPERLRHNTEVRALVQTVAEQYRVARNS